MPPKPPAIGIVGKPNVGKSTLFNAITLGGAEVGDFPFTTIEPNVGIGYVRVPEPSLSLGLQAEPRTGYIRGRWRFVPVKIIDVAGLVPGAHEGKGLGNKFLSDAMKAEALIHVIDASGGTNEKGENVPPGSYDPTKDVEWLEDEIVYWLCDIIERNFKKIRGSVLSGRKLWEGVYDVFSGLGFKEKIVRDIFGKVDVKDLENQESRFQLCKELLRKGKPVVIAANKIDVPTAEENIAKIKQKFPYVFPVSALAEFFLKSLDKEGKIEYIPGDSKFSVKSDLTDREKKILDFIEKNIIEKYGSTGVQEMLDKLVFDILGYIPVFPVATEKMTDNEGRVLPDCYLVPKGTTARELAYMIHTDLGEGFVRAKELRSGKIVGKDYVLQPGDVIMIISH